MRYMSEKIAKQEKSWVYSKMDYNKNMMISHPQTNKEPPTLSRKALFGCFPVTQNGFSIKFVSKWYVHKLVRKWLDVDNCDN